MGKMPMPLFNKLVCIGMSEYTLTQFGIAFPVDINGALTILREVAGAPVVLLVDEHHTTPDCISQNEHNTNKLISPSRDHLVGVESHAALDDPATAQPVNEHPEFAIAMVKHGFTVIGVENTDLCDEVLSDIAYEGWPAGNIKGHPNNQKRSRYFIELLSREFQNRNLTGWMVLNAGRSHIDDIVAVIKDGTIDALAGAPFSYIRLRAVAYPDETLEIEVP